MISLGRPLSSYRLGALFELCRLLVSLHPPQQASVVLQCISDGWVIGIECLFVDRQRSLVEGFGFCVLPLIVIEPCQIMEGNGDVGVIRLEGFLFDR